MEAHTLKLYSPSYKDIKTYLVASTFIVGNTCYSRFSDANKWFVIANI